MARDRTPDPDSYERSAGGMDYDDPMREHASSFGSTLASGGPEAFFGEVEKLLPEKWREQISLHPLTAMAIAVGVGVFLGMKKGEQIIAAGSAAIAAAATANLNQFMRRGEAAEASAEDE